MISFLFPAFKCRDAECRGDLWFHLHARFGCFHWRMTAPWITSRTFPYVWWVPYLWTGRTDGDHSTGTAQDENCIWPSLILYIVYNFMYTILVPHSQDRLLLLHMFLSFWVSMGSVPWGTGFLCDNCGLLVSQRLRELRREGLRT